MKRRMFAIAFLTASMVVTSACGSTASASRQSTEAAAETTVQISTERSETEKSAAKNVTSHTPDFDATDDGGDQGREESSASAGMSQFSDEINRAESVCPYEGGILISNFGGGEGGYVLYRKDGETKTLIAPGKGLKSPTGMAVGNGMLFVCDGDTLKVFELSDPGKGYREIYIAGSGHLFNDAAVNGDDLYISVTDEDAIYRMDISSSKMITEKEPVRWAEVPGPNGITTGNGALYIASISKDFTSVTEEAVVYRIPDLSAPEAEVLIDVPGLYDGVALSDDGKTLYYSDWNTVSVRALDLDTGETKTLYQEDSIGPADIAQANGVLYVPDLPGSRILEITVEGADGTLKTE